MEKSEPRPPLGLRWKRFAQSLLTFVIAAVAALLIGEALVFTLHRDRVPIFPRYVTDVRYGGFHVRRNVPDARYRHKSVDGVWEFTINRNGFRDTCDFAYEKPEGRRRVLVLGDSYTIGYEVHQEEAYPSILESYLRRRGFDVEVLNAGMSGSSTAEELVFLEQEGVRYRPDVVVVGFYKNDLEDNIKAGLYRVDAGELTLNRTEYIPAIRIRNRLNAFPPYRWLSQHSYLHNYLNNVATNYFKKKVLKEGLVAISDGSEGGTADVEEYMTELGRAVIEKIYEVAHTHGADVILLEIPSREYTRSFPWRGDSDLGTLADVYVEAVPLLSEYEGLTGFRRPHGQGHLTPFVHLIVGVELGRITSELFSAE